MGDGNCLLHALSLACWGEDRYSMLLKAQAALELITVRASKPAIDHHVPRVLTLSRYLPHMLSLSLSALGMVQDHGIDRSLYRG